jgi:hypothetical protein
MFPMTAEEREEVARIIEAHEQTAAIWRGR